MSPRPRTLVLIVLLAALAGCAAHGGGRPSGVYVGGAAGAGT